MSLLTFILLLSSSLSAAASVIYKGTGDEVVISAGSGLGNIEAVTWKHNEDIAVEWYGGEPSVYRHFIDHTTLNTSTGALTISGLTRDHSGSYTAEINNRIAGTTEIRIISPVPKPTVSMQCDAKRTYCTLTCEGDTTDAELVTYSWEIFDVLNFYKGQQVNLTKEDHDPWYRCEMKNPISSETSEEFPNPFSSRNRMFTIILVLGMSVLVGVICVCVKGKSKKENAGLNGGPCNGVAPAVSTEGTSAQNHTSHVVLHMSSQSAVFNINETSNPDQTSEKPDDESAEESTEESNGDGTTIPLLERNQSISVSA